MKIVIRCLFVAGLIATDLAWSLTGVNPTGVNINRHGVSTVFLTFQGTSAETPGAAFWCTRLSAPPNVVTATNPCVPGSVIGSLPARFDLATPSGALIPQVTPPVGERPVIEAGARNTTDIMTIPASVARRALQLAREGEPSAFFYVREFVTAEGLRSYVSVTCRMAGGGARSPLALIEVDPGFVDDNDTHVRFFEERTTPPELVANLRYTGTGRLRGRWEVVMPGEPLPSVFDLLPAGSLPVEQRGLQKPYTVLSRFDVLLPPLGEFQLPGPPRARIPTGLRGAYQLLLRIEATGDKEGDSNTLDGIAQSGGVAGFPMPVVRYFVGLPDTAPSVQSLSASLQAVAPPDDARVGAAQPLYLAWSDALVRPRLQLEIANAVGEVVFTAMLPGGNAQYLVPRHVRERASGTLLWRVIEPQSGGTTEAVTSWRRILLLPAVQTPQPDADAGGNGVTDRVR